MATTARLPSHSVNNPAGLDLASGMTAGIGPEQTQNQGIPGEQYGKHPTWWPQLTRIGAMRILTTDPTMTQYVLNFLYNPNQIAVAFQIDVTQLTPAEITNPNGIPPVPNAIQAQTVTWSLYFDRTYDMINNTGASRGVLQDVAALYNIMGLFTTLGNAPLLNPVQVIFGQDSRGTQAVWGFQGFITVVNITYGIFRGDMIPSRCEVDLTMMARYLPTTVPPTAGTASPPAAVGGGQPTALATHYAIVNQVGGSSKVLPPQLRSPIQTGYP